MGKEENLLLASCCAEQGHVREMISYLVRADKKGEVGRPLLENILGTYKKYGWGKELEQAKKIKLDQFNEREAEHVLSLLTPEKYKEAIRDFSFGWFFDPLGYLHPEASALSSSSEKEIHFSTLIIRLLKREYS
jgi:hypothetical protein